MFVNVGVEVEKKFEKGLDSYLKKMNDLFR